MGRPLNPLAPVDLAVRPMICIRLHTIITRGLSNTPFNEEGAFQVRWRSSSSMSTGPSVTN
jgi:hypothetical protein